MPLHGAGHQLVHLHNPRVVTSTDCAGCVQVVSGAMLVVYCSPGVWKSVCHTVLVAISILPPSALPNPFLLRGLGSHALPQGSLPSAQQPGQILPVTLTGEKYPFFDETLGCAILDKK